MNKSRRKLTLAIVIFAITAIAAVFYWQANSSWQEEYKKKVAAGTVRLLQDNPYDQISVVVIVVDGLRWEDGIGDLEHEYIPHIWNDLVPKGSLLANHWIQSPTVTTSSHSAMMTGRLSTVPNDGHIRPVFPSYMQLFRDARTQYTESKIAEITSYDGGIFRPTGSTMTEINSLLADAREFGPEKTALYLGKDLIYRIAESSSGRCPNDEVLVIDSMRDIEITEYFRAKIPDVHPNMVFINLGDVDECGHEAEWEYYADSIKWADGHVWEMWQALQAETRYRDKTYFIITTDHGRHLIERGGYVHHGCFCEGCRHAFMLLIGPGIKEGFISNEPHTELDLAPTIGKIMGFATPASTGEPIEEVFESGWDFPVVLETELTELVRQDVEKVDERDTIAILTEQIKSVIGSETELTIEELALLAMSINPDNMVMPGRTTEFSNIVGENYDFKIDTATDLAKIWPALVLGIDIEWTAEQGIRSVTADYSHWDRVTEHVEVFDIFDEDGIFIATDLTIPERAMLAAALVHTGRSGNRPPDGVQAAEVILRTLAEYEGEDRVFNMDFEDFLDDYRYREGPNEIFTEKEISMRDTMWLLWAMDYVLEKTTLWRNNKLERQHRLLVAFMHEWQDANAMVSGTGDEGEEIDFVAQGLALSNLSNFEPWRRWELDELGYSMDIYRTPLFSWPPHHFFYLLGQANALAGGWAANERLQLFIEDDGTIRRDLPDQGEPLTPGDEDYIEAAAALVYGLSRFERASYDTFDLEMYPIVYQQE